MIRLTLRQFRATAAGMSGETGIPRRPPPGRPCYDCYMAAESVPVRVITHRELRNNSSEILRAVQAGAIIEVTNHGSAAAILLPPSLSRYERLIAAGKVRQPEDRRVDLRRIARVKPGLTTAELIADVRGDR